MATEWYYQLMGIVVGPLSASEFRQHAQDGKITPESYVCKGKDTKWVSADRVKGLFCSGKDSVADQPVTHRSEYVDRIPASNVVSENKFPKKYLLGCIVAIGLASVTIMMLSKTFQVVGDDKNKLSPEITSVTDVPSTSYLLKRGMTYDALNSHLRSKGVPSASVGQYGTGLSGSMTVLHANSRRAECHLNIWCDGWAEASILIYDIINDKLITAEHGETLNVGGLLNWSKINGTSDDSLTPEVRIPVDHFWNEIRQAADFNPSRIHHWDASIFPNANNIRSWADIASRLRANHTESNIVLGDPTLIKCHRTLKAPDYEKWLGQIKLLVKGKEVWVSGTAEASYEVTIQSDKVLVGISIYTELDSLKAWISTKATVFPDGTMTFRPRIPIYNEPVALKLLEDFCMYTREGSHKIVP